MSKRLRKPRRLRLESLESRKLMAGDVAVALEGQLLTVRGDDLANQIVVSQDAVGNVTVAGQQGTLINGRASVRFLNPALNSLEVRMEGGDDVVTLRGVRLTNDLFVDLGSGNDRLASPLLAPISIGANATIEGSEGNDSVVLAGTRVQEDLFINGGLGTLSANVSDTQVDKAITLISDDLNDLVVFSRVTAGDSLSIETKGGADTVNLTDLSALNLQVTTDVNGIGLDRVTLNRVQTREDLGIFTGDGNDVVSMTDVTSGKGITVSLDNGNDQLVATRVSAATDAVFEGGAGFDILRDLGIRGGIKKELKEFERIS